MEDEHFGMGVNRRRLMAEKRRRRMFSTLFLSIPVILYLKLLKDFDQMMKAEIAQSVEDWIVLVKERLNGM